MKQVGETIEALFDYQAMSLGFVVLKPNGDSAAYDRVIDGGAKMLRVQIKATTYKQDGSYLVKTKGCTPYMDRIDIMAVYVIPESKWYIFPWEGRSVGTIRITKKMDQHLNNWSIFKHEKVQGDI